MNLNQQFMYDTFHIQRAISVQNWSDAKNVQNIDIYGPYTFFGVQFYNGRTQKKTGRKSPQNTKNLPFLSHMQNSIFVWTSPDNTNKYRNKSNKIS